jgi:predicted nuclease with TOPRIM domain
LEEAAKNFGVSQLREYEEQRTQQSEMFVSELNGQIVSLQHVLAEKDGEMTGLRNSLHEKHSLLSGFDSHIKHLTAEKLKLEEDLSTLQEHNSSLSEGLKLGTVKVRRMTERQYTYEITIFFRRLKQNPEPLRSKVMPCRPVQGLKILSRN